MEKDEINVLTSQGDNVDKDKKSPKRYITKRVQQNLYKELNKKKFIYQSSMLL